MKKTIAAISQLSTTKYSDSGIRNYFYSFLNPDQISTMILNDQTILNLIMVSIIQRHINLRDALMNPTLPSSQATINEYSEYLWDKNEIENGMMRGPQTHLSHQMYTDFFNSGSSLNYSAEGLKNCAINSSINLNYDNSYTIASQSSFRQSIELAAGTLLSKITTDHITMTNDDPMVTAKFTNLISNMPRTQTVGDFVREKKGIYLQEDIKNQSLGVSMSVRNQFIPRIVCIGTVSIADEKNKVCWLAQQAVHGAFKVSHIDPKNKTDVKLILQKISSSGKIEDSRGELIGFPMIISNRHND